MMKEKIKGFIKQKKKPAAVLTEATRKLPPFSVSLFLTLN